MRSTWRFWWLPALLLLAVGPPVHAQSFGFPWWRDAQFQRELSLTTDQTARIESLFFGRDFRSTEDENIHKHGTSSIAIVDDPNVLPGFTTPRPATAGRDDRKKGIVS